MTCVINTSKVDVASTILSQICPFEVFIKNDYLLTMYYFSLFRVF